MFEVECLNLINNKRFTKWFFSDISKDKFVRKCKYSKKIKVLGILDYSNC